MLAVLRSLAMFIVDLFKSPRRLEAENLFLRHQLSIALRRAPPRLRLRGSDRALLVWMTRLWPSLLGATQVVQPETILRWHRAGFKAFWRWKSRTRAGRSKIDRGLRDLIRRMSNSPVIASLKMDGVFGSDTGHLPVIFTKINKPDAGRSELCAAQKAETTISGACIFLPTETAFPFRGRPGGSRCRLRTVDAASYGGCVTLQCSPLASRFSPRDPTLHEYVRYRKYRCKNGATQLTNW